MNIVLLSSRLLLTAIFFVAGAAKLADRRGTKEALVDFGLPPSLSASLSLLLPLAELAVATALMPSSTVLWGALGALLLLLLFAAAIGVNLTRGKKPYCHCFGQLYSTPVGWKTLARNGMLAAVAAFLVWQGWGGNVGPSAVAWIGALSTAQLLGLPGGVVVLGLLGAQWWFLLHLMRQNGRLLVRFEQLESSLANGASGEVAPSRNGTPAQPAEGLPVGTQAPFLNLEGLYDETSTLDSLLASAKPVMLLFTDPNCGPCDTLLPEVGQWQEEYAQELTLVLISRGEPGENKTKASEHGLRNVLVQKDWEVSESYEVAGTPSAVLVSSEGKVASPVAAGAEGIRGLLAHAVGDRARLPMQQPQAQGQPCPNCGKVHPNGNGAQQAMPAGVKVGESAPEMELPDLEGNTVTLRDFGGKETLMVFWNPGCGFCQQMLPDLKEWEANRTEGTPGLLLVSAGSEEANREMGLSSTVVLDQQFAVGHSFGAGGTPSAVLVDVQGKVASEVAVGAPAVLGLAGAERTEA